MKILKDSGFYNKIFEKISSGVPLSFEEAYSVAAFVCSVSNRALLATLEELGYPQALGCGSLYTLALRSIALLSALSTKEKLRGLTPYEIAGLVAGVLELDTVYRVGARVKEIFGIGGMGGDRGLGGKKVFNVSTLSALVLSEFGLVHKHHSYPNTSKVAGQSAIESFGARSDFYTPYAFTHLLNAVGLVMSSAHGIRTVHNISHILRGETVNHIIGPLAIPQSSEDIVNAVLGVNHNVHPATVIEALKILESKGIQRYGNSVAFCALEHGVILNEIVDPNVYYSSSGLKKAVVLDEIAPPGYLTLAAFKVGEKVFITIIFPEDFFDENFSPFIENTPDAIVSANHSVINRNNLGFCYYTAQSAALGLFTRRYAGEPDAFWYDEERRIFRVKHLYLQSCFKECLEVILTGKLRQKLELYINESREVCKRTL